MTPKNFKLLVLAVPQRKNIFSSKQINLVRLPPTNSKLDEITYNFWFQSWHRQKKHFSQIRSNRFFFIQSWKSPFIYLFKTIDKIAQSYGFVLRIAKTFIAAILVPNAQQRIFINSLWICITMITCTNQTLNITQSLISPLHISSFFHQFDVEVRAVCSQLNWLGRFTRVAPPRGYHHCHHK